MTNPAMIDTLTAWRYWILRPEDSKPVLRPFGPHDTTVWHHETTAGCRHDPSHTPPHVDCTCGLFAMTLLDVRYAVAARRWLEGVAADYAYRQHKGFGNWLAFGQRFRREWIAEQPKPVIGKVLMRHAVEGHKVQPTGHTSRSWRARSATILALYVPEDAASAADSLSADYSVPCTVGYPSGWSQDEWDTRSRLDGCFVAEGTSRRYPPYEEFGLLPPTTNAETGIGRDPG